MFFAVYQGDLYWSLKYGFEFCLVRMSWIFIFWHLTCVFRRADARDLVHRFGSGRISRCKNWMFTRFLRSRNPAVGQMCISQVLAWIHVFAGSLPVVSVNRFLSIALLWHVFLLCKCRSHSSAVEFAQGVSVIALNCNRLHLQLSGRLLQN